MVLSASGSVVYWRSISTPRRMLPSGFLISCASWAAADPTAAKDSVRRKAASDFAASVTSTRVVLQLTIRTYKEEVRQRILASIERIATTAAFDEGESH